uniref:Uncharacterized protein n=1 Tax=Anguilla anguilla TaxID=7936 RepID=A0A0E9X0L2_ANGAN
MAPIDSKVTVIHTAVLTRNVSVRHRFIQCIEINLHADNIYMIYNSISVNCSHPATKVCALCNHSVKASANKNSSQYFIK